MILHEVISTEKVPFSYRVAGLGSRLLAWLCDLAILFGLFLIASLFFSALEPAQKPDGSSSGRSGVGVAMMLLALFTLVWGYFVFFEWLWQGQTPGKRIVGIRVIDLRGTALSFFQSAVRNVLRMADGLPFVLPSPLFLVYGLGFAVAAGNREQRRLGDLAAGTLVVFVERKAQPIQALHEGRSEADRVRQALLRQRLSQLDRLQKQTLLDLCLRREQLRVTDRARLFRATAEYFQSRLDLTPDEYQSDEKFVLQLAAALTERGPVESEKQAGLEFRL